MRYLARSDDESGTKADVVRKGVVLGMAPRTQAIVTQAVWKTAFQINDGIVDLLKGGTLRFCSLQTARQGCILQRGLGRTTW